MVALERLFLTADRCRVVREHDPAAAFLLAAKGAEIPSQFIPLLKVEPEAPAEIENRETRVVTPRRRR
jgi:hypothetical protein